MSCQPKVCCSTIPTYLSCWCKDVSKWILLFQKQLLTTNALSNLGCESLKQPQTTMLLCGKTPVCICRIKLYHSKLSNPLRSHNIRSDIRIGPSKPKMSRQRLTSVKQALEASFKVRHVDGHVLTQPENETAWNWCFQPKTTPVVATPFVVSSSFGWTWHIFLISTYINQKMDGKSVWNISTNKSKNFVRGSPLNSTFQDTPHRCNPPPPGVFCGQTLRQLKLKISPVDDG